MVRSTLLAALGGIGALAIALAARPAADRLDGEYGLWVEDRRDSMVVHWITREPGPGLLNVQFEGGKAAFTTPSGRAHAIAFRRPPRVRTVTLVYGAKDNPGDRDTTIITLQLGARTPQVTGTDSLFIIGDTHGQFDNVLLMLRGVGLINDDLRWVGGRRQLVLTGDLMDRGDDVTRLLWYIYGLEREAAAAGGRVHTVLGNHETMVWMRDLRYVPRKEFAVAEAHGVPYDKLFDIRESVLGKWLVSKPAVLRVDNVLIAHGGVSAQMLGFNVRTLDDTLSKYVGEELFYHWNDSTLATPIVIDSASYARRADFFLSPNSVFWYREYARTDTQGAELDRVLRRFGAVVHVIGHTPSTMVHQKYDGKLINAHPRTPAVEMVLLVREGKNYRRFRIDQFGNTVPLPALP